jgi:hypothetical protein
MSPYKCKCEILPPWPDLNHNFMGLHWGLPLLMIKLCAWWRRHTTCERERQSLRVGGECQSLQESVRASEVDAQPGSVCLQLSKCAVQHARESAREQDSAARAHWIDLAYVCSCLKAPYNMQVAWMSLSQKDLDKQKWTDRLFLHSVNAAWTVYYLGLQKNSYQMPKVLMDRSGESFHFLVLPQQMVWLSHTVKAFLWQAVKPLFCKSSIFRLVNMCKKQWKCI